MVSNNIFLLTVFKFQAPSWFSWSYWIFKTINLCEDIRFFFCYQFFFKFHFLLSINQFPLKIFHFSYFICYFHILIFHFPCSCLVFHFFNLYFPFFIISCLIIILAIFQESRKSNFLRNHFDDRTYTVHTYTYNKTDFLSKFESLIVLVLFKILQPNKVAALNGYVPPQRLQQPQSKGYDPNQELIQTLNVRIQN
jgi:hypothetical protein